MDASFGPNQLGTNEALINNSTLSQTSFSLSKSINDINRHNQSIKRILKPANIYKKHDLVPTQYIKHNNETNLNECTIQSSIITQENNVITPTSPVITSTLQSINPNVSIKDKCLNTNSNDCHLLQNHMDINRDKQVPFSCLSGMAQGNNSNDRKNKWNMGEVHITCNPLSTPYPYSTPHHNIMSETVTEPLDDEPKSRSCGNFLPILSLIPQTVISFQYLSPKMKFSWWRNKIS
ncbi:PREDICTED: uncharacterized protein LOC108548142 isoform X2 [Eufriesea mexicana]|uniref:uncharacterized protein LOC108548142 isoform X2 n=1 Tax=Eufriesea mexicana TaxID=516756 RepID=UPI00083C004C|nr:PREDICTED: uncharacterized protein LOC108548142 isoform X2 [Eufriesea mexicana]